jgi:hypothetical protein
MPIHTLTNVVVGYGVGVLTQVTVFPLYGLRTTMRENLAIGAIFTAVWLVRSFALRRAFEAIRVGAPDCLEEE